MQHLRFKPLKQDIYDLLDVPANTHQILMNIRKKYDYISWKPVKDRLEELEKEGKIKSTKNVKTTIYYK